MERIENFLKRFNWQILGLIILSNALLKTIFLNDAHLYLDEPYTVFVCQMDFHEMFAAIKAEHDPNAPMFFIFLHYWISLFGISEISVKSLSIIFSLITAFFIFTIGRKFFNHTTAFVASLLFLFTPIQQHYAQEARCFSMVTMLVSISYYFYFELLANRKKWSLIGLALVNSLAMYTHYLVVYAFIVQFIGVLFFIKTDRKVLKLYILSQIIALLVFIPQIIVVLKMNHPGFEGILSKPDIWQLKYSLYILSGNKAFIYLGIPLFLLFYIVSKLIKRPIISSDSNKKHLVILFLLFVLPILLNFLVSQISPFFTIRYMVYTNLGFVLFLAYFITVLNAKWIFKVIIILALGSVLILEFDYKPEKLMNWKKVAGEIKKYKNENDLVLVSAWWNHRPLVYYYNREIFKDYKNTLKRLGNDNVTALNKADGLEKRDLNKYSRIFLVKHHQTIADPESTIKKYLESIGFILSTTIGTYDIPVEVFANKSIISNEYIMEDTTGKWIKKTGKDILGMPVTIFFNGFENDTTRNKQDSIVFEGKFAYFCKPEELYCSTFKIIIDSSFLKHSGQIECCAEIYSEIPNPNAHFPIQIEGHKTLWLSTSFLDFKITPNNWSKIENRAKINFSEYIGCTLKVYVWNPNKCNFYMDNIVIKL